jgi:hypothetical protein
LSRAHRDKVSHPTSPPDETGCAAVTSSTLNTGRSWLLAVLGALGLSLCALACTALVLVLDFAWSDPPPVAPVEGLSVPPPVYGPLPSFTLRDDQGHPLDTGQLRGQVTLLQFTVELDAHHLHTLRRIQERLESSGVPTRVVLAVSHVPPPSTPEALPPGWHRVWDSTRLEVATRTLDLPWSPLVLVDQRARVRGAYDSQETERLVEDARCLLTCGPFDEFTPPSHSLKRHP